MKLFEKLRPIPGWQSEDPFVRVAAVRDLDGDSRDLLVEIARHDEDPTVRREAVRRIQDVEVLAAIAVDDADEVVRKQARGVVRDLVIESAEMAAAEQALAALPGERDLVAVARSARLESISRVALSRLNNARALGSVARRANHPETAKAALARLEDPAEIEAVVLKADDKVVAVMAFERLTADSQSRDTLEGIARRAKQKAVARRAKAALVVLDEALTAQTNNAAARDHVVVCQRLEALATADDFEHGREALDQLLQRWAALDTTADVSLTQRFADARRQVEAHLAALEGKQLQDKRAVQRREEALALRRDLCLRAEQLNDDGASAALQRLREEWTALPAIAGEATLSEKVAALTRRFEAGVAACEHRVQARTAHLARVEELERLVAEMEQRSNTSHDADARARWSAADKVWWSLVAAMDSDASQMEVETKGRIAALQKRRDAADSRRRAARAEARAERDRRARKTLAQLEQRCELVEGLVASDTLKLAMAERELRATRTALEELDALPVRHGRHAVGRRLKRAQIALLGRVRELKDFADWQRWANLGVQEDLCREMEALGDVSDDAALAGRLDDIMARWRQASEVPEARGKELWQRFKAAHDSVYPRCQAYLEARAAERERNLDHRRKLVEEAERLASSGDWLKTVRRITELQAEWKTAGPIPRREQNELWHRFRTASSTFFSRRKADLSQRKQEWARNLELKEALCTRVETLAETDDVPAARQHVRQAQAKWKRIGPVHRTRSDAVWQRFRAACDVVYEHTHAAERQAAADRTAEREALCVKLEALLPEGGPADESPERLAGTVRDLQQRWRQAVELPQPLRRQFAARFGQAIARIVWAYPDAFRGTDLDPARQLRRLEELCERVEAIVDREIVDDSNVSPAEILAAKWRDALANNLMGVRVDEVATRRAAIDEVKRLQTERRRLGRLPGKEEQRLSARFQRACDRLVGQVQPRPERFPESVRPTRSAS